MDNLKLAKILYNVSLDMDYADSQEYYETEVKAIADELESLKGLQLTCLLSTLERIAENNEIMENWLESKIEQ